MAGFNLARGISAVAGTGLLVAAAVGSYGLPMVPEANASTAAVEVEAMGGGWAANAPVLAGAAADTIPCSWCENDFDDPPPQQELCETWGFEPFCGPCDPSWPGGCLEGMCSDVIISHWAGPNGTTYCGKECDVSRRECGTHHLALDGTRPGLVLSGGNGVRAEPHLGGLIFRDECGGGVVGRVLDPVELRAARMEMSLLSI